MRPPRNKMEDTSKKVLFKAWFINKLGRDKRLQPHHYEIIMAYMSSFGLSDKEPAAKYDYLLKSYFGK